MITKIDKETLNFMGKKKLTFNQFCICLLLYNKDFAGMQQYTHQIGFLSGGTYLNPQEEEINELEDLIKRGYIKHAGIDKNDFASVDNFILTDKFLKGFLNQYIDAAKEFWDAYPNDFLIEGHLKSTAKVLPYEDFQEMYIKIITPDFLLHNEIMRKLKISLSGSKYASMKIFNYLASKQWENTTNDSGKVKNSYH